MRHRRLLLIAGPAALLCSAAFVSGRGRQPAAFTVRDSAGIRIVESVRPALDSARGWRVDAAPILAIGSPDGDTLYSFTDVFLAGRLSTGEIVVAEGMRRRIRYFTPEGRVARSIGRAGQGPNEFPAGFFSAHLCGDSVFVRPIDYGGRVIVVSPRPTFARVFTSPASPDGRRTDILGCNRGRSLWMLPAPGGARTAGLNINRTGLGIHDGERWLGIIPSLESGEYYSVPSGGADGGGGGGSMILSPPFKLSMSCAMSSAALYVANSRAYQIQQYALDGSPWTFIRMRHSEQRLSNADRARVIAPILDTLTNALARTGYQRMLADAALPTTRPSVGEILVDADDNLWVREYDDTDLAITRPAAAPHARRWAVFAPDGHLITAVVTPARVRIVQIGRDFVLGIRYTEDDVPLIHLYALRKPVR